MTGIVREVDPFAPSTRPTRRDWLPNRKQENGRIVSWRHDGHVISETTNNAGLLAFQVFFPSGQYSMQSTRAEAEEYAEDHMERY